MPDASGKMQFTGNRPSPMLYLGVGMVALLKDLLDFVGLGSLPAIGTIVTACFSFLIWMLLTLFDHSGGKGNRKQTQGLVLFFFSLVEGLGFGLNFLPVETLSVIVLYMMSKKAWKKEMKLQEGQMSKQQGQALAREIALERQRQRLREEEVLQQRQLQESRGPQKKV